jgi:hypothetical protein
MNASNASSPANGTVSPPSTIHTLPSDLPKKARARLANRQRLGQLDSVDNSLLVIQDDCGNLIHAEGDLGFLMPSVPVVDQEFHTQLNAEIQDGYRIRQRYVWNMFDLEDDRPRLQVGCKEAVFLPMFVDKEEYTITVFADRSEKVTA